MKKFNFLILPVILALLLSACGTQINERLVTSQVLPSGTAANDPEGREYMLISENTKFSFWFNKDTTAYKVFDKRDGFTWFSYNPEKSANIEDMAPFTLTYLSATGTIEKMDAMNASVKDGQYKYERTDDGIKVIYSVGDYSQFLMVPFSLTEERFDSFKNQLEDDFEKNQFENMYKKIVLSELDESNKKAFLKKYPKLKEQPLYILRDSIASNYSKMKDLASLLLKIGYTENMYKEDSKYFESKSGDSAKNSAQFRICIEYDLNENGLSVTIPAKEIQMNPTCPLLSIELGKYFASPQKSEKGYFLLPDGSGSIMKFYNGREDLQEYNTKIYGTDFSLALSENAYNFDQAYLPIWAVHKNNHSVLSVIEKGAAIAEINAYPGSNTLCPYAAPTFFIRTYQKTYSDTAKNPSNYFVNIQNDRYEGDISVNYNFFSGEDAEISEMAEWYSNCIFGVREDIKSTAPGLILECVGLIEKHGSALGVNYTEKIVSTTFDDVAGIAGELKQNGIENLNIKLSGWNNGALRGGYQNKLKINNSVGAKEKLLALAEKLKKDNIGLYPDVDFQYTYTDKTSDGFSAKSDSTTLISKARGYKIEYNPATFCRDPSFKTPVFINNPSAIKRAFNAFFVQYNKLNLKNISLNRIGRDINSDYSDKKSYDREETMNAVKELVKKESRNYGMMVSGANAYLLGQVDYCTDIPLTSDMKDNTDESVPFVEMVLSGKIRYSTKALNLAGGSKDLILRMASVATDAYYVVMKNNSQLVTDSDYSYLYCSDYDYLKDGIIREMKDYQKKMSGLSGQKIISYKKLTESLYRTVFRDGSSVTVNYGNYDIAFEGKTYKAKSYDVEKGGN